MLGSDTSELVKTDTPLQYSEYITGCTYIPETNILSISTDNGIIEYQLTFIASYVSLHLGTKYYEPYNPDLNSGSVLFTNNDV